MIWLMVGILILSAAGGTYFVVARNDSPQKMELLRELGMVENWQGKGTIPFYKWSWEKSEDGRVSAEKIVQDAFQKARVLLDDSDLAFFREKCQYFQAHSKGDEKSIQERIDAILARSELLRRQIAQQVEGVIQSYARTREQNARALLEQAGIKASSSKVSIQYGILEMQRLLNRIGMQVLACEARGILLNDPQTGKAHSFKGLDVWEHCVTTVQEEIMHTIGNRNIPSSVVNLRAFKIAVDQEIFKDLTQDIREARDFRETMKEEADRKGFSFNLEKALQCDPIFYEWKFMPGAEFRQGDHNKLRRLVTRHDLSLHFRERIMQTLDRSMECLGKIVDFLPRNVIFYGSQPDARAFMASQYIQHFYAVLDALAALVGVNSTPPMTLSIPEEELDPIFKKEEPAKSSVHSQHALKQESSPTLEQLIEKHQRLYRVENEIRHEEAEARGWIIDLAIPDYDPPEMAELQQGAYAEYVICFCDTSGRIDFEKSHIEAQKSRLKYFNRQLDVLLKAKTSRTHRKTRHGVQETQESKPDESNVLS